MKQPEKYFCDMCGTEIGRIATLSPHRLTAARRRERRRRNREVL